MIPARADDARLERALRILALDDSESDIKLMERTLRAGDLSFAITRVETRQGFEQALRKPFDVILVDYKLPHFDGLSALRMAKRMRPDTPVIIVTGSLSDELAVEFLQEGAADYILKDRRSRLAVAISRSVEEARLKKERVASEERYQTLFRQSRDAVATLDCPEGVIVDANPAFAKLSGRAGEALRGMPFCELASSESQASVRARLAAACGSPGLFVISFLLRQPDGKLVPVELVGTVSAALEGRRVQVMCREAELQPY